VFLVVLVLLPVLTELQPMAPKQTNRASKPTIAIQARLRRGTPKSSTSASAVPPAGGQNSLFMWFSALVGAVVFSVSVAVCAVLPLMVTEVGDRLHVTGSTVNAGVTEQLRLMAPVNPFAGVTVIVEVFPVVAPGATVTAVPLNAKVGAAVTVSAMVVEAFSAPELPLRVTVTGPPRVAALLAASVSTLEPVAGLGANDAVTPLGKPEAARVTLPVNPPTPVTEIELVALLPWPTDSVAGAAASVKPGGGLTVRARVADAVTAPELPVRFTVTGPAAAAVLLAVRVSTLAFVAGLGANDAVTPLGKPEAARVTLPLNPPMLVMKIELAALLPWPNESVAGEGASVNPGGGVTVRAMAVEAVSVPEVPLMFTITGPPTVAALLAVSVITLELVAGLGLKDAVTPLGRPVAASVTLPLKLLVLAIDRVLVPLPPWASTMPVGEGKSVNLVSGVTVSATLVEAVSVPEVPLMVTVTGPASGAELLAVSVSTLELAAGLGVKEAVTPLGSPEAVRVTFPLNPPAPVTWIAVAPLLP